MKGQIMNRTECNLLNAPTTVAASLPLVGMAHLNQGAARSLTPSVRVPINPASRAYVRFLRNAEMEAWHETAPATGPTATRHGQLRGEVANALAAGRRESALMAGLLVVAMAAVMGGMALSTRFVTQWEQFVSLLRQLLG